MTKAFHTLKSMELDDEDKLDAMPVEAKKPDFPYGLRICLTEKEFDKLGLDHREAEVGATFHGHFMARVTAVHASEEGDGKSCRVEAQIEDLDIEGEDEEDAHE